MNWCWFQHEVKNDYECWIAIERRKELVKQKMKIFKYFSKLQKNQFHFFTKMIDFDQNLQNCPFLPFLISLLRSRLQNFRNWLLQCCWLLLETSWLYSRSDHDISVLTFGLMIQLYIHLCSVIYATIQI